MTPHPCWPPWLALGCLPGLLLLAISLALAAESGERTYGPVRPGETLWQIAGRAYPNAGFDRDRVMLTLLEANPDALSPPCNVNGTLRVGARLRLPAPPVVADLDGGLVRERIAEQRRLWAEHRRTGRPLACPPATVRAGAMRATGETLGVWTAPDGVPATPAPPEAHRPPVRLPSPGVAEVPAVSAPAGRSRPPRQGRRRDPSQARSAVHRHRTASVGVARFRVPYSAPTRRPHP